jgi:hypothetical protein
MAEEVLKYKVQIDSSDVAEQLTSIRSQVDLAMGSLAAQQVQPSTFARIAQVFETANVGNIADKFRQKFETDTTRTIGGITQMLDQTATQMQLGYGRFTADARRLGLLSPTQYPDFQAPLPQMGAIPPMNTTGALAAAGLGSGFDPTGTFTMQEYRGAAVDQLNRDFKSFLNYNATETTGTALGAGIGGVVGGVPGAIAGGLIGNLAGGVGQAGLDMMTGQARAVDQMAGGLAELGAQNIAGAPGARSEFWQSQAQGLMDSTRSQAGRANGLGLDEVQNQISAFASAGGFKGMDPGGMSVALTQLPGAVRSVSQNLNISQDASAGLLADMQRLQLGGDNLLETSAAAVRLGAQGNLIGATPSQMLGTASQGIQMVSGTTMAPADAANLAVQSRLLTSQAQMAGAPGVGAFVNQQGGAGNAAFANMEQNLRHMMSPLGMARTANIAGGGNENASVSEAMAGAASYFSDDPSRIFSSMVDQGSMVGQMNPLTIQNAQVQDAVGFLRMMPQYGEGAIPASVIGGAMMSMDPSMSASQAMNQVGMASRGGQDYISNQLLSARDTMVGMDRVNQVGPLRQFTTGVTQPFVNFADATVNKFGRGMQDMINNVGNSVGDTMSEILTGELTTRNKAVLNSTTISDLRKMVDGDHEQLNELYSNVDKLNLTEEETNDVLGSTYSVVRSQQTSGFLGKASSQSPGVQHLRHDSKNFSRQGYNLFGAIGMNASHNQKLKLAAYVENEVKQGRIKSGGEVGDSGQTNELMLDIVDYDKVVSGYAARSGTHDMDFLDRQGAQEDVMLTLLGGDPLAMLQTEDYKGLSQFDQMEKM